MYLSPTQLFERYLEDWPALEAVNDILWEVYETIKDSYALGNKLLLCGNGGSAADCEHIVGELMKGFLLKRPVPPEFAKNSALAGEGAKLQGALPAISLTGHSALSTAYANDVDPDMVFAQQVYGYGRQGDVLLGLSTSGNAKNVCHAIRVAHAVGMKTIGITGKGGGVMKELCSLCICLPATETYRIQELTLPVYHALCAMLEAAFFSQ